MTIHILHVQPQSCRACGRKETLSTLYTCEALSAPGRAQKLLPCHSIGPMTPINVVHLPLRLTPICASCVDERSALEGSELYARWQETLARKAATPGPIPANPSHGKRRVVTLDDLA